MTGLDPFHKAGTLHEAASLLNDGYGTMQRLEEYAEHARSCREAAERARTAEEREHLLHMAERWEGLARQRAAHLHLEEVLAEILKTENGPDGSGGSCLS